jgi:signal-transduction protein with cAMP-binding, CBS, and nucleotidyltransferase domain
MSLSIAASTVNTEHFFAVPPTTTVAEAARLMTENSIGSVMVVAHKEHTLLGLFTERDLMTRVVAKGLNPATTTLDSVMTKEIVTVTAKTSVHDALQLMRDFHCRHLPIIENNTPIGMVSVRDLYSAVIENLEHDVREKEAFIFGGGY